MVAAHHLLLTRGLGVEHLRLIFGTSMGCHASFVWGETYPNFMDALMPMACLPVADPGRNRIWRKMVMDSIRRSGVEQWRVQGPPKQGVRVALDFLIIAGSAPLQMPDNRCPRGMQRINFCRSILRSALRPGCDDFLYQVNASRNYDPSPQLRKSQESDVDHTADDFIQSAGVGIAERKRNG